MYRASGSVFPNGSAAASDTYSEAPILTMAVPINLNAKCGKYLTFRDLVECGETWADRSKTDSPIVNWPTQAKTVAALERLCLLILDPVIEHFGPIEITYGFSGLELSNRVRRTVGRVSPALDQHASHEHNSRGKAICPRGGAAADFRVSGDSSLEVAKRVVRFTPFDRLYFYGDQRPIHVSYSDRPKGQIVVMTRNRSGRRVPTVRANDWFLEQRVE